MNNDLQLIEVRKAIDQELDLTSSDISDEYWLSALNFRINELIRHDFHKLLFILYRLDVDELKVRQLLNNHPQSDASKILSELIIERQLQKVATRKAFRRDNPDINESERW